VVTILSDQLRRVEGSGGAESLLGASNGLSDRDGVTAGKLSTGRRGQERAAAHGSSVGLRVDVANQIVGK